MDDGLGEAGEVATEDRDVKATSIESDPQTRALQRLRERLQVSALEKDVQPTSVKKTHHCRSAVDSPIRFNVEEDRLVHEGWIESPMLTLREQLSQAPEVPVGQCSFCLRDARPQGLGLLV
jgi:hypothetical protein